MSDVLRPNIFATGASDDAAAAGQIFPTAGIYQSTPDEVDNGDVGRVRMSARRARIITADYQLTFVEPGDVTGSSETIDGIVFSTFDGLRLHNGSAFTTSAAIIIPMMAVGFEKLWMKFYTGSSFMDQDITVLVNETSSLSSAGSRLGGKLTGITISASANVKFSIGGATIGTGGTTGGATVSDQSVYPVIISPGCPYVAVRLSASSAPTTGAFGNIAIGRSA